jgi:hypothetical protein
LANDAVLFPGRLQKVAQQKNRRAVWADWDDFPHPFHSGPEPRASASRLLSLDVVNVKVAIPAQIEFAMADDVVKGAFITLVFLLC